MPRAEIKFDEYKTKAFLDANIILECRPLAELPWVEVDSEGPIIALITPTAMREVDSKKQDGRIGKRAREFNRLIAPVATGGSPIVVRESSPRVELALSRADRIPWDAHDDLDPADGDSRIVAEALYAKDMCADGKVVVSHDIKPIALASGYDLTTVHVSDDWLRPTEPGKADKENQKLKQRIAELQVTQPEFQIKIEIGGEEPITLTHIEDLSSDERYDVDRAIRDRNPKKFQPRNGISAAVIGHDSSYDRRYAEYEERVERFLNNYAGLVEKNFNQTAVSISVENVGKLQADHLLIEVSVTSGWLHDRFALVSPQGPRAPVIRSAFEIPQPYLKSLMRQHVGRHEFEFKEEPDCRQRVSVTCEDFRHGQAWAFEGAIGFDPRIEAQPVISVVVTAANYRGTAREDRTIRTVVEHVRVSEAIDLQTVQVSRPSPLHRLIGANSTNLIDSKAFDRETDEDDD